MIYTFFLNYFSAGTATAYLTGVKANFETIGVGPRVDASETDCNKIRANSVNSFLEECRKENKSIGVVTTARITVSVLSNCTKLKLILMDLIS